VLYRMRVALGCALLAALTGVAVQAILLFHAATQASRALRGPFRARSRPRASPWWERSRPRARSCWPPSPAKRRTRRRRWTGRSRCWTTARTTCWRAWTRCWPRPAPSVADANAQLSTANGTLAGVREDLKPALQATQSTVKDLRDSWDDLYWDVKASVESATVAARGVAEAAEAAGKAAPKLAAAAVKNGDNVAGITADVHTATSAFVKPKSTWQKIKSALWLVAYGAARAI